ncbi:MMPL family transporter [Streptomyces sp. NBC_01498]|uniref:MMPL family transporter n=1 Tax=Streptomyces sp. NBC_01498 TaxID=2975870 RepID=UPI002E7BE791|nr:MMPL family transporter [Streptomyces sp. NBC_01498]WTL23667.1 MMPL family transporter [Streptomyces sp. NBC_01498]
MLSAIAELALKRARLLLVLTTVAVVALGTLGAGAFGTLLSGGFQDPDAPSSRAAVHIDKTFGGETNLLFLVGPREAGGPGPGSAAFDARGRALTDGLRNDPAVSNVASYWDTGSPGLLSEDGGQALVALHVKGDETRRTERAEALIDRYTGDRDGIRVRAGGATALGIDISTQVSRDLALAEAIAVPVTLLLLVLAFGSLVAATLPLVIGLVAIAGTFALLFVLGSATEVSVFAVNLTTALGLGLGIDYALLLVSRFREQLGAGDEVPEALRTTVRTAGRTVLFSAATVAAALAALLVFPQYFLRSFAYAGIGVVAIAVVAALLVVPPLLAVLGHRVNAGRVPWATAAGRPEAPFWGRLAALVMRRPALTALPVVAVLLLVASPLLGVAFGTPDERVLPEDAGGRQVATAVQDDFPADEARAVQIVSASAVGAVPLGRYAGEVSRLDGVVRVDASTGTYTDGRTERPGPAHTALGRPDAQHLVVVTDSAPTSGAAQDLVADIRALERPGGTEMLVGGADATLVDSKRSIGDRLPLAAGLVVVTTFLLLFLFTGSVVQPLRALLLNAISLSAAVGAMVWIFQDGHLSSWLGFTPQPMDTSMTVLLFCVAFGLSMDYEVFVTSRMKESHDAGADRTTVVTQGLARTGRIVSTAAGLLAVSFFAFGTSGISFLQMFGLGTGLAIVIDAVAVRGVLVPAAMRLLGRSAWYAPAALRRLHRRVGLAEEPAAEKKERAPVAV